MDIAVTGSSGLIGSRLMEQLRQKGHRPVALVRRSANPGADEIEWRPDVAKIDAASLEGFDGVVNLAGAGIGDKRWNNAYRTLLVKSRTTSTALLASALAGLTRPPSCLLSGSAIGFYRPGGDQKLTETSTSGDGFLADLCMQWEAAAAPAIEGGIRTAFLRTGIVLSPHGGALAKMLPLFKMGIGGRLGSGSQYMSWITIDDEVDAIITLLSSSVAGPVNLTAPEPVTNRQFTAALGRALDRPTLLPVPAFGPKLVLGRAMAQALLFDSLRVVPAVLSSGHYLFQHRTIDEALATTVGQQKAKSS